MKRSLIGLSLAALLSGVVSGQAPQTPQATPASAKPSAGQASFDAADVHVRAHGSNPNPQMSGGVLRGGRYDLRNATMVDLISMAYGVDGTLVLGGPNWLETDRFDVVAKAPQTTPADDVKLMLQALLADRFKLALHKETKPQQGFVLAAGSGKTKMKQASGDTGAPGDCNPVPPPPDPAVTPQNIVACRNIPMSVFVQILRGMAGAYVNGPITDLTGITDGWDFDLKWTNRALLAQAGADGISMSDAIDKQLGLKLESRSIPTAVLIVDSVNQKPTDNPSNITQVLPPAPPAEFEVASVKLSDPTITQPMGRIQPGGRVDLQGFTLRNLLTIAWDITDDELLVGPKWIDDTRYSIVARTSTASLGAATANTLPLDIDDVRVMMRALLIDRLKMKTHVEDRPVTAYTLLAAGPKLTKADPANRTGWKNGPAPGARDPRDNNPILARLVTGRNMSMAQLAEALPAIAPGYIRTPVVDETGITGNWDFTFTFTPNGVGGIGAGRGGDGGQAPGAGGAPSAAAEPSGAISLFDALNKQLGLRLQVQKRPLPVVVIDSAEQKPSDD
jgi:uncharacterized protein (TIGR03435 family)